MRNHITITITTLLCLSAAACRKKDNTPKNCILTKTVLVDSIPGSNTRTQTTDFTYANGAVSGFSGGNSPGEYTSYISRSNDLITAFIAYATGDTIFDTLQIDAAGFVLAKRSRRDNSHSRRSYVYDGSHHLQYVVAYINDTLADSTVYTWSNGDCVSMVSAVTGATSTFSYYDDIAAAVGDYSTYYDWFGYYGARTLNNAHAVKIRGNTSYTYKLDNGNIISSEVKTLSPVDGTLIRLTSYTYTYDCK